MSVGLGWWFVQVGWQRELVSRAQKLGSTCKQRGFLRQIINITVSVMYYNGTVDICIIEGKYQHSPQY